MKRVVTFLLLATLLGCSKKDAESAISDITVYAIAYAIHYKDTHNPSLAAQCARSVSEKYANLTDIEQIAAFAPKAFKGLRATYQCAASQMAYANDLLNAREISSVPIPLICFEKENMAAMQALEPATREFIVPVCSTKG
ncbi:hypothetical protein [Pseudomonas gingeri]|uniref:hypothetical protein n=1 Tax=Pseudomonas gingeri TaxID=117681 RepID=UPI0015BF27B4|nr:hypothetical protein [Pseudomonas gingeri]NWD49194.1 hypothetical protein [Pseudomonas gingeri]